jgi:hypothetical protein
MEINGQKIMVEGKILRVAKPHANPQDEWFDDIDNPEMVIDSLRKSKHRPDILTFWQRLPHTKPKYRYTMELDSIAALPIKSYSYWWEKQIDRKARNKARKAEKKGVIVRPAALDDRFIGGIISIFNETPIRQGRRYQHYGKDFETVKREFSRFSFREEIFGAYLGEELVGFIMLCNAGNYLFLGQIISKIAHRDLAPNNALLAKAVERCVEKGFPYLVYAYWLDDALGDFKRSNGFQKFDLPRYFVPLSRKGQVALSLGLHRLSPFGLHRGWKRTIPKQVRDPLKKLRAHLYKLRGRLANECNSR